MQERVNSGRLQFTCYYVTYTALPAPRYVTRIMVYGGNRAAALGQSLKCINYKISDVICPVNGA